MSTAPASTTASSRPTSRPNRTSPCGRDALRLQTLQFERLERQRERFTAGLALHPRARTRSAPDDDELPEQCILFCRTGGCTFNLNDPAQRYCRYRHHCAVCNTDYTSGVFSCPNGHYDAACYGTDDASFEALCTSRLGKRGRR